MNNIKWRVACGEWKTHAEQSAAARRLLLQLAGSGIVAYRDSGAPYLPEHPELHISISHCRTAVAVAVCADRPVGIDIECRRSINTSLIQRVCTTEESYLIQQSDDPALAFLRLWTRKEAVLKCRGTGIKGFGSMVNALKSDDMELQDLPVEYPDTVCSLATVKVAAPSASRQD